MADSVPTIPSDIEIARHAKMLAILCHRDTPRQTTITPIDNHIAYFRVHSRAVVSCFSRSPL